MQLLLLVWRQYRWPFIAVMALSLASAALGIGLIAFINVRLIEMVDTSLSVLPGFLGLLLLLMAVTLGSQLALTAPTTISFSVCAVSSSNGSLILRWNASSSWEVPLCWRG